MRCERYENGVLVEEWDEPDLPDAPGTDERLDALLDRLATATTLASVRKAASDVTATRPLRRD